MAITDPAGQRGRNMSAFVIEKGTKGFRAGKKENKLGIRASDTSEVVLKDCFVPDDQLLGEPGEGFKQAMSRARRRPHLDRRARAGHRDGGVRDGARLRRASASSSDRPISQFQAIGFALAEMSTRIAAAEALTLAAALEMDRTGKVTLKASEAKLITGEAAVFCSERGVQIHGGYGFVKDYRAEKYYRDAKICTIGEGTSEVQRLVIARELLSA